MYLSDPYTTDKMWQKVDFKWSTASLNPEGFFF